VQHCLVGSEMCIRDSFRTKAGYGKSAGFLGPNYFYRYFMGELIFLF
jgi:hypothetical protein